MRKNNDSRFSPGGLIAGCLGLLLLVSVGCSSRDDPQRPDATHDLDAGNGNEAPDTPREYGGACDMDDDCRSKLCVDGFCSKLCRRLGDCEPVRVDPDPSKPAGTLGGPCKEDQTCGRGSTCHLGKECLLAFDCGRVGEATIGCYPQQYDARPYTTGHDCSLDGICAQSYECMGQAGASDRFCSPTCDHDRQCPPHLRCARLSTTGGKTERRCMLRRMGHPCDIDDQCWGTEASELGCVMDVNGNGYCSKTCSRSDPGTCPPFAKCEEAGGGRQMCKYKAGFAYTEGGTLCDPCIRDAVSRWNTNSTLP